MKDLIKNNIKEFCLFTLFSIYYFYYLEFYSQIPIDDAFTHMRIARNFAEFGKPFYNLADPLIGSSSHVWILLVTILFKLTQPIVDYVVYLQYSIFILLFYALTYLFSQKYNKLLSVLLSFSCIAITQTYSTTGLMESQLASLFFTLYFIFALKHKLFNASIFLSLAVFTRNEFSVLWVLNFLYFRKEKEFYKGSSIVFVPMMFYLFYFYSTFIPQPYLAKKILAGHDFISKVLLFFSDINVFQLISRLGFHLGDLSIKVFAIIYFLITLVLFGLKFKLIRNENKIATLTLLYSLILLFLYITSKNIYVWYWPNLTFPIIFLVIYYFKRSYHSLLGVIILPRAIICIATFISFYHNNFNSHYSYLTNLRLKGYEESINYLVNENKNYESKILISEIGIIGWMYKNDLIDLLGLVSKRPYELRKLTPNSYEKVYINTIKELKPNYIIDFNFKMFEKLLNDLEKYHIKYELVKEFKLPQNHIRANKVLLIKITSWGK